MGVGEFPLRLNDMKAYQNEQWINSASARLLRIVSEYLEPKARFDRHNVEDTIVFMGSARLIDKEQAQANLKQAEITGQGIDTAQRDLRMSQFYEACQNLASRLTQWSKELDLCGDIRNTGGLIPETDVINLSPTDHSRFSLRNIDPEVGWLFFRRATWVWNDTLGTMPGVKDVIDHLQRAPTFRMEHPSLW